MRLIVGAYECKDITFIIIGDKETTQIIETNLHVSLIYAFKMNSSEWQKSTVYKSCCMLTTEWTIWSQQHPAVSILLTAECLSGSVIWWWRWARNKGGHVQFSSHHFCLSGKVSGFTAATATTPLLTSRTSTLHTETYACTHSETHACAHTSTWQTCRAQQCESTGNHPVRETEGRQWMTGMVSSLTHTGNHLTR